MARNKIGVTHGKSGVPELEAVKLDHTRGYSLKRLATAERAQAFVDVRIKVKAWMRTHLEEHRDARTGEVNCTTLVEAAAAAFELDEIGGVLDAPDSWIWDLPLEMTNKLEETEK